MKGYADARARNARSGGEGAQRRDRGAGAGAAGAAENVLSGALRQLFALSEAYPDLKANTNFQQLQTEIADIENKIAAARRFFNNAVQEYNTGIEKLSGRAVRQFVRLPEARILRSRRIAPASSNRPRRSKF